MKIGFGIILYDKFEETKILADIIKSFDKNFYVLACTNKSDSEHKLKYENIDRLVIGEDLPFDTNKWSTERHNINLIMRVTRNIQQCNQELIKNKDLDYCVFLHSDSWMLDPKKIYELINTLKKKEKIFAVMGVGFGMMTKNAPLGNILDMLWIYDRKEIETRRLFEFDVVEMMPHQFDSHGIIANNLVTKVGFSNIYYYANTGNAYFWKNKYSTQSNSKYKYTTNATPALIIPEYNFIHIHTGAFPEDLGLELQAYYLRENNILKGKTIEPFLNKYTMSPKKLFEKIEETDRKTKRRLFWHGLSYESLRWGKNYEKINRFLNRKIHKKIKTIFWCWALTIFTTIVKREAYYQYFYGSKIKEPLNVFYSKNLFKKEIIEKQGHSKWYYDKNLK
ncbi:hypothetical protein K9L97_01635 [Candidatus Woesearchaeota archaeon]|nr:hypothetical protein [Candidatus Woesearchaeota archaeon]